MNRLAIGAEHIQEEIATILHTQAAGKHVRGCLGANEPTSTPYS